MKVHPLKSLLSAVSLGAKTQAPRTPAAPAAPAVVANEDQVAVGQPVRADRVAVHGVSAGDLPSLLEDWRKATFESAVEQTVSAALDPRIAPTLEAAEKAAGRTLTRAEAIAVIMPVLATIPYEERIVLSELPPDERRGIEPLVRALEAKIRPAYAADVQATIDAEVSSRRQSPPRKDPFTPIAQAAPKDRGEERVLWENASVMVVVDLFARQRFEHSHVLVIPKRRAMLPIDLHPAELLEVAKVCAVTRKVFQSLSGAKLDHAYFNPPADLSVAQAHAHLETGIADGTSERELDKVYDRAAIELAAALRKL